MAVVFDPDGAHRAAQPRGQHDHVETGGAGSGERGQCHTGGQRSDEQPSHRCCLAYVPSNCAVPNTCPCIAPSTSRLVAPACNRSGVSSARSEEHTSELQSRLHLVCRLLLEKKKKSMYTTHTP